MKYFRYLLLALCIAQASCNNQNSTSTLSQAETNSFNVQDKVDYKPHITNTDLKGKKRQKLNNPCFLEHKRSRRQ